MYGSRYMIPNPKNEAVLSYLRDSIEHTELLYEIKKIKETKTNLPAIINGESVFTKSNKDIIPPHDIYSSLGVFNECGKNEINYAINSALNARKSWASIPWHDRVSIFLKAADLIAGPYRAKINAATMLGQSKNIHQAEIDSACELIDFLRFNAKFMGKIYEMQPSSGSKTWNRTDWRPLEGFIFALTPFNFTSIAGNLPTAPAIMGNTVVWKPSKLQVLSASVIMEVLIEAGLPDGVINMVFAPGPEIADIVLHNPDLSGVHFTGSTRVFQKIWSEIGVNISKYKSYPHIVGETGGKDFVFVHKSADIQQVVTALTRGAFEYQGQKCSAASRAYIPEKLWSDIKAGLEKDINSFSIGSPEEFNNFINAVIDMNAFDKLSTAIENIKDSDEAEIIIGGHYEKTKGFFIYPTVVLTKNPYFFSMKEELFGPILTIYLYDDKKYEETLELCNKTSEYGLTGSVFAKNRNAIIKAEEILRFSAGNFYINDKPTGAVVNQQPFGGARGSGTNDKAGSLLNLIRWTSPRTIKENFVPPTDYRYPFLNT